MAPLTAEGWQPTPCESSLDCPDAGPCEEGSCVDTGGFGGVVIAHFNDPTLSLTDAVLNSDGSISGDPTIVEAHFILLENTETPVPIFVEDPLGSDSVFDTVYLQNQSGILTTVSPPPSP